MQTQVTLNNQAQTYIAALLENNIFDSADDAVNSILQQQFEKDEADRERVNAALQVGLDQIAEGKTKPFDWDRIEQLEKEIRAKNIPYRTNSSALPPLQSIGEHEECKLK